MPGRVEYQRSDSLRSAIAAVLLAAATGICINLVTHTPGSPARLAILLCLPMALASVLSLARRGQRWARWLAIYGWVAALALYLEPVIEVWPFGALALAVVAALALTSSLLIPDSAPRGHTHSAPTRTEDGT